MWSSKDSWFLILFCAGMLFISLLLEKCGLICRK
uniref:Uncharacterized protein n=1 Tax=Anguilla anguilla TaxID=7936 RepID=A0A0E9TT50_ANGAN